MEFKENDIVFTYSYRENKFLLGRIYILVAIEGGTNIKVWSVVVYENTPKQHLMFVKETELISDMFMKLKMI